MRALYRNSGRAAALAAAFGLCSMSAPGAPLLLYNDIPGCPTPGTNGPECNGKLELKAADMGDWYDYAGFCSAFDPQVYDYFNPGPDPVTGEDPEREFPSFMQIFFLHVNPDIPGNDHGGKVAFSDHPCGHDYYNRGESPFPDRGAPANFELELVQPNTYITEPTSMDSIFKVTGTDLNGQEIDITVHLTQSVATGDPGPEGEVSAYVDQTLAFTNNTSSTVDLILVKHIDEDMPWVEGPDLFYLDDSVGVDAAELGYAQTYAQDGDPPVTTAALMLRTTVDPMTIPGTTGWYYYLTKGQPGNPLEQPPGHPSLDNEQPTCYVDPSCSANNVDDPLCPPYVAGTDFQYWERPGTPNCWKDYVPGIGYGTGNPGFSDPAVMGDSSIGLDIEFTLGPGGANAPAATYEITFRIIYGFRPTPPRFLGPKLGTLLVDGQVDDNGLAEYLLTVRNSNPGGGQAPDKIHTLYLDVEAGKLGASGAGNRSAEFTLEPAGWTVEDCTSGFDAEGHALFKLSTDPAGPNTLDVPPGTLKMRFRLQANDMTEDVNADTGTTVAALAARFSLAQDHPDGDWVHDACDAGDPFAVFGPSVAENGGFWSLQRENVAYLQVPSLSTWAKALLLAVVAGCGLLLVLRSRRPMTT